MPTGFEVEEWKSLFSIAQSLEKIALELEILNKKLEKITYHDCVSTVDMTEDVKQGLK